MLILPLNSSRGYLKAHNRAFPHDVIPQAATRGGRRLATELQQRSLTSWVQSTSRNKKHITARWPQTMAETADQQGEIRPLQARQAFSEHKHVSQDTRATSANMRFIRVDCFPFSAASPWLPGLSAMCWLKGEPHKYAAAHKQFPRHIKVTRKLEAALKIENKRQAAPRSGARQRTRPAAPRKRAVSVRGLAEFGRSKLNK